MVTLPFSDTFYICESAKNYNHLVVWITNPVSPAAGRC